MLNSVLMDELESRYDKQFKIVFDAIRRVLGGGVKERKPIGFVRKQNR